MGEGQTKRFESPLGISKKTRCEMRKPDFRSKLEIPKNDHFGYPIAVFLLLFLSFFSATKQTVREK